MGSAKKAAVASKKTPKVVAAPVQAEPQKVEVAEVKVTTTKAQVGADALRGRVSCRTHAMHEVLVEAFKKGSLVSTKDIVAGARALLGEGHASFAKLDKTAPSHLNTMKGRGYVERVTLAGGDGVSSTGWRLTAAGAKLVGLGG
jgi:hypothetical protein